MKTTIDRAGRIVIPKRLREELGLGGGEEVNVTLRNGYIAVEPVVARMKLVERDGFLAAEIEGYDGPPLTAEDVREVLERVRR
jgi:AbrB family looped-hinge helix DNA binding protein